MAKKDINERRADNADRLALAFVIAGVFSGGEFGFRVFAIIFGVLLFAVGEAFAAMVTEDADDV